MIIMIKMSKNILKKIKIRVIKKYSRHKIQLISQKTKILNNKNKNKIIKNNRRGKNKIIMFILVKKNSNS